MKTSWRIINTGTEGIDTFESGPTIHYPKDLNVEDAKISSTSSMLKIDKMVNIDKENKSIGINNLGIFNPGDYFTSDIYFADIPGNSLKFASIEKWNLKAKALNLGIKKDISIESPSLSTKLNIKQPIIFYRLRDAPQIIRFSDRLVVTYNFRGVPQPGIMLCLAHIQSSYKNPL